VGRRPLTKVPKRGWSQQKQKATQGGRARVDAWRFMLHTHNLVPLYLSPTLPLYRCVVVHALHTHNAGTSLPFTYFIHSTSLPGYFSPSLSFPLSTLLPLSIHTIRHHPTSFLFYLPYPSTHSFALFLTHSHPFTPMHTHSHSFTPMHTHSHPFTPMHTHSHSFTPLAFVSPIRRSSDAATFFGSSPHAASATPCPPCPSSTRKKGMRCCSEPPAPRQ